MKITGKVGKEGEDLFKQWVSGYLNVTDVLSRSNPANWLQTQLEFAMKTLSVDMKVDMDTLAKKMQDPIAREKLFEIAGLNKETTEWMQKTWAADAQAAKDRKEDLNFNDWLKGFQEKYEEKTSQDAKDLQKKTNEAIAAQSRPVTDAIEQMIERWLTKLYITVRKIWAHLAGNKFDETSISLEEQMIKLNEEKRDLDRKMFDATDAAVKENLKKQIATIDEQIAETSENGKILNQMREKGDIGEKWIGTLEKRIASQGQVRAQQAAAASGAFETAGEIATSEQIQRQEAKNANQMQKWLDDLQKQAGLEKSKLAKPVVLQAEIDAQKMADAIVKAQQEAEAKRAGIPIGAAGPPAYAAGATPAPTNFNVGGLPPAAKDVEVKSPGFLNARVSAGDLLIDKKSMADFRAGPRGAAIPAYATATGTGNTINDNRNVQIIINQRDAAAITQLVREAIYTDKMAR